MTTILIDNYRITKGNRYWVDFIGQTRPAKVIWIKDDHGVTQVKFRVGLPIFGFYVVESLREFHARLVKG